MVQSTSSPESGSRKQRLRAGVCPTCKRQSTFSYIGEQHWPHKVALKRERHSTQLWLCKLCETTVAETRLVQ